MKFVAEIDIMPHQELLDPQGKTVAHRLPDLDISGVEEVRIGKHVRMQLEASSASAAEALVDTACRRLLANPIMETYTFSIAAVK